MPTPTVPPARPLATAGRSIEREVRDYMRATQEQQPAERNARRAERQLDAFVAELRGSFRSDAPPRR